MAKKRTPIPLPFPHQENADGEREPEYEVGKWSGQAHYRCMRCAFDTLDKERMLEHLVEQHSSTVALEELFPSSKPAAQTVRLQEPVKAAGELVPEGDPANGVFEISITEVDDGTTNFG